MTLSFFQNIPKIDNSGAGNCMYHAYSISLMAFLRVQETSEMALFFFNQLKISEENQHALLTLLAEAKDRPSDDELFSRNERVHTIERILSPAVRNYGAEITKEAFLINPQAASFHGPANYGMIHAFKNALRNKRPELGNLINNNFDDRDYTEADIFRVSGMKKSMNSYAEKHWEKLTKEFDDNWTAHYEVLEKRLDDETIPEIVIKKIKAELAKSKTAEFQNIESQFISGALANEEFEQKLIQLAEVSIPYFSDWLLAINDHEQKKFMENLNFQRENFLGECIAKQTTAFLQADNNEHLDQYINRMKTEFVWGTEETLLAIHAQLQGEQIIHDPVTDQNTVSYRYPVKLAIFTNGQPPYGLDLRSGMPELIINNQGNYHWTSLIPEHVPLEEKLNTSNGTHTHSSSPEIIEQNIRKNLLVLSGFDLCLKLMKFKKDELQKRGFNNASEELNAILTALEDLKKTFLSGTKFDSRKEKENNFVNECKDVLDNSPKEHLQEHRSIFGRMLNALKSFIALCLSPIINYKLHALEPSPTDSIAKINQMDSLFKSNNINEINKLFSEAPTSFKPK